MESSFSLPSWIRQAASQKSGLESHIDKTHSDAVALRRMGAGEVSEGNDAC